MFIYEALHFFHRQPMAIIYGELLFWTLALPPYMIYRFCLQRQYLRRVLLVTYLRVVAPDSPHFLQVTYLDPVLV